ncbi:acyl-CoA dehydratase activase-related protein [Clostridium thermarum]|uniref:acyl-CoA dehydratase activase-related protein n=1 Tax=Clostridium thermarum TaxID=1716543 RepID=UPI0013D8D3CB|nr:acyl-CoA dehydratase activase-related protein [Clostridium thermarum]
MVVGIPKGLMYWKYGSTLEVFLKELGIQYIVSPDTSRDILDRGVNCCVDDACLPIKIFHGHVHWLKDRCDLIITPRIMKVEHREYICPKFCGLIEMLKNSIEGLPRLTEAPLNLVTRTDRLQWFMYLGKMLNCSKKEIVDAYRKAEEFYNSSEHGHEDRSFRHKVALMGHTYNVYDNYVNMNIKKKLNKLGIGVITEERVNKETIERKIKNLYKKPFWSFAKNSYGASVSLYEEGLVDGIIYISSFACGIDSIVIELIKEHIGDFPFMVLKIDEHTGEAGIDTRIEAFSDMLERRKLSENKCSKLG